MKLTTNNILLLVSISLSSAFLSVFIYATMINPVKKIYIEESVRAKRAAEKEILFSDQLNAVFRSATPTSFIETAANTKEAVVFVRSLQKIQDERFFSDSYAANTGSGVIISEDGYIATNYHVVEDATDVEVMLNNNKEYQAKVIGSDPNTDLALLKIEESALPFLIFGNSDSLQVGEWVMAVGNPFKLQSTVTAGIVSAKGRNINILENRGIESFIQTDAAVNPGNSGGALVNTRGQLMGINAAIISVSGGYEGFSFAIPANLAKKVMADLKKYGAVQRGWMGVELENVDSDKAKAASMDDVAGVYIARVSPGGAADDAGLKSGDIVINLQSNKVTSLPDFMEKLAQYRPGDKIRIEFLRKGLLYNTSAILRNQLNTTDYVAVRKDKILTDVGFELRELDSYERARNKSTGVKVVSVFRNSKIGRAKLESGFIITKINNQKVENVNQVVEFLEGRKGTVVVEGFYENYPGEFPYTFDLE